MRATDFEFRNRFWIIGALYAVGFSMTSVDHVSMAGWLAGFLGGSEWDARLVLLVGAAIGLAAALLRTWASAWLRSEVVKDGSLHVDRVVADGPYRHVRNPLYLGTWLQAVGFGLAASRVGYVIIAVGMLVFLLRLVGREQEGLTEASRESYARYVAAVPAFLPSPWPRLPPSGARPAWGQAFLGEAMCYFFFLALLMLALTFDVRWFFAFLAIGIVSYFPISWWRQRFGAATPPS